MSSPCRGPLDGAELVVPDRTNQRVEFGDIEEADVRIGAELSWALDRGNRVGGRPTTITRVLEEAVREVQVIEAVFGESPPLTRM